MNSEAFFRNQLEKIEQEEEQKEQQKVNIRAILPSQKVGKIVARDGSKFRELRALFPGVELSVDRVSSRGGCLVHTFGQAFELQELWKEIIKILYLGKNNRNNKRILESTPFYIDFLFPDDFIELLNCLDAWKNMANLSRTKITIKSTLMFNSTERLVRVSHFNMKNDTIEKYVTFIPLVSKYINENSTVALSSPGNIFYVAPSSETPIKDVNDNDTSTGYYWGPYTEEDTLYDFTGGNF